MRLAEAVDDPFSLTQAYFALGSLSLRKGDVPQAIPVLERGLDVCQDAHILTWLPTVAAVLGYAYALAGRAAEALPLLQPAAAQDPLPGPLGRPCALDHLSGRGVSADRPSGRGDGPGPEGPRVRP